MQCWPHAEWRLAVLGAGFDLHEVSQLAFAPVPVKRTSGSVAGCGHVDNLLLLRIPF